ncbi:MAG TPA: efflux RND transporter permease subunit, partial [Myxococcota bacterium]
ARGVALSTLAEALRAATGTVAAATVIAGSGEALLRASSRPALPTDLCSAVVVAADHATNRAPVVVCDVADVFDDRLPRLGAATKDGGGEVVYVMVQMLRDENALVVAERIEAAMPAVRQLLDDDIVLDVHYDRRALILATLTTVGKSLLEGGSLVMVVLLLLLGSVRAGLIVAAAIPLSMIAATALMTLSGTAGNLMSLGAIDFGLVVDGSVVLVERLFHIVRHQQQPTSPEQVRGALVDGARDVVRPVAFAVVIIVAVYLPVLALQGVDGKMFRPMALTMVFALLASLAIALTVVPALASLLLRPSTVPAHEPRIVVAIGRAHDAILRRLAPRPLLVGVFAVGVLAIGVAIFATRPTSFLPQLDEGDLIVQTTRAADIGEPGAVRAALRLERLAMTIPEVKGVSSRIGSPAVATDVMGIEQADVFIHLHPPASRQWRAGLTKAAVVDELAALLARDDAGSEAAFTQPIQMRFNELVGGDVNDVAIAVFGADLEGVRRHALQLQQAIAAVPGAVDVRVMLPPGVPIVDVVPRSADLARTGLRAVDVLDAVQAVRLGVDVGTTWRGPLQIPIVLRLNSTVDAFTLGQLPLPLPASSSTEQTTTLASVADIVVSDTPAIVSHGMGQRRVVVGFNVRGRDLGAIRTDVDAILARLPAPSGMRLEIGGQFASLDAASARLLIVVPVALVLVLLLLVGAFRAVRPAVIILVHVPFAAVGGGAALAIAGLPLSMPAAIGFIALAGIAVLNGVVLMHDILARQRDVDAHTAAIEGARARLLPVTMTASVAAFGFVPMMLASGVGAEVQRPLATVVVGGLFTSTALTLFILPTLYPALFRLLGGRDRAAVDVAVDDIAGESEPAAEADH